MTDAPYYIALSTEEIDGDPVEYWAVRDEHACACAKFYVDLYKDEDAKERAETERDRLNAEWRKEIEK